MRAQRCGIKSIGEILRFVRHQTIVEFHIAHCVRWHPVIAEYEFGDPEIAVPDNSLDCKALLVWLGEPALSNVMPAADPLARLRIIEHSVLAIDFNRCPASSAGEGDLRFVGTGASRLGRRMIDPRRLVREQ